MEFKIFFLNNSALIIAVSNNYTDIALELLEHKEIDTNIHNIFK